MTPQAADAATARSLLWLDAYRAEEAGQFGKAAEMYGQLAIMHREAGLPKNGDHFAEMARICRSKQARAA